MSRSMPPGCPLTLEYLLRGAIEKRDQRIAELEAEVERLREQVKLLRFQLRNLREHPEFHNLSAALAPQGDGSGGGKGEG